MAVSLGCALQSFKFEEAKVGNADLAVVGLFEANVCSSAFWNFCRKQQLAFEVSLIDTFVSLMHGRRHRWTKIQFCKYMSNGTVIIL